MYFGNHGIGGEKKLLSNPDMSMHSCRGRHVENRLLSICAAGGVKDYVSSDLRNTVFDFSKDIKWIRWIFVTVWKSEFRWSTEKTDGNFVADISALANCQRSTENTTATVDDLQSTRFIVDALLCLWFWWVKSITLWELLLNWNTKLIASQHNCHSHFELIVTISIFF